MKWFLKRASSTEICDLSLRVLRLTASALHPVGHDLFLDLGVSRCRDYLLTNQIILGAVRTVLDDLLCVCLTNSRQRHELVFAGSVDVNFLGCTCLRFLARSRRRETEDATEYAGGVKAQVSAFLPTRNRFYVAVPTLQAAKPRQEQPAQLMPRGRPPDVRAASAMNYCWCSLLIAGEHLFCVCG